MRHEETEEALRELCEAGDFTGATTRFIESYGPEVLRFLMGRLRSESDAWEVFSVFCEDLWRGLPGFAWRSTARAWAYAVARHAQHRFLASPHRRAERNLELPGSRDLSDAIDRIRTSTELYRRTDVKDRFRQLRERLDEEDQLILILKVDRGLSWLEIASALGPLEAEPSDADLKREAARLRKRFQLVKKKLRGWAEEEGLLPPE